MMIKEAMKKMKELCPDETFSMELWLHSHISEEVGSYRVWHPSSDTPFVGKSVKEVVDKLEYHLSNSFQDPDEALEEVDRVFEKEETEDE